MIGIKYMNDSYYLFDTDYPSDYVQHPTKGDAYRGLYIYLNILGYTSDKAEEFCKNCEVTIPPKPKITRK